MPSDLDVIRKAIRDAGYSLATAGGHEKVVDPEGNTVWDPGGGVQLAIPGTPGDWRWRRNIVAQLIRLGVLAHDPFSNRKPTTKKLRPRRTSWGGVEKPPAPPQRSELLRRDLHWKLVQDVEAFFGLVGGWGRSHRVADAAVCWMGAHTLPGSPRSVEEAESQLTKLCGGQMLPLAAEQAWQQFLDEINSDSEPLLRWIELQREARGI